MKTVLFVILDKYADWEAAYLSSAISVLGKGAYEAKTVSLTTDTVSSIGGFHTVPDYDLASVPKDYEALVLIGGESWGKPEAITVAPLVRDCFHRGKTLAGICAATAFLGSLGILNNVCHTCNAFFFLKRFAGSAYTGEKLYREKQSVSDNGIITANGSAPVEFARDVLRALQIADEKKISSWYDFHKLGSYYAPWPGM